MIPWISCREVVDFLDRYLTGELDPDEVARFERHLSECPPCVAYMHTYQSARAVSRAVLKEARDLPDDVPEDLVQAILRAREEDER
jgi:anti-sigma factor (TIGR02949 family)